MDMEITIHTKIGVERNTPNAPEFICPISNLSAQAQKFWILMKKGFIGRPQSVVIFQNILVSAMGKSLQKVKGAKFPPICPRLVSCFPSKYLHAPDSPRTTSLDAANTICRMYYIFRYCILTFIHFSNVCSVHCGMKVSM